MNVRAWMASVVAAAAVAGCGPGGGAGGPGGPGGPGGEMMVKVKSAEAKIQPIEEKISLVASISANESIEVRSEMDGTVEQINFREGQPVKEGQLLIKLDTRKLDASVAEAEADFNLADTNRRRAETMLKNQTVSQQEFDQAQSAYEARKATLDLMKQQQRDARIVAPFGGIAGARLVSPGQVIARSTPLTSLVDVDPVKIEFNVPERFVGQLRVGQTVEFRVAAYPGQAFQGDVYFVAPQVDPSTRTVLVKASQANADGRLRPGMFGNLDLILRVKENAVLAPESAIIHEGDRTALFIVDGDGRAQRVDVVLGTRIAGHVEVLEGLKGGEQVIHEGIQKVFPGVKVITDEQPAAAPTA